MEKADLITRDDLIYILLLKEPFLETDKTALLILETSF